MANEWLSKDVTEKVNWLLAFNGANNLTGAQDLNPVFGDVAPREAKILRVSLGTHWRDLREVSAGGPPNKTYDISGLFKERRKVGPPSIFIAVFSRRAASTRRGLVRNMWKEVSASGPNVNMKFVLCDVKDESTNALAKENKAFNDLLFLPCTEGYGHGALTQKVLVAMEYYRNLPQQHSLFMKVDDDTFVAWDRFSQFLARQATKYAYIGVPIDAGIPCRNASFRWYEPYATFNDTYFPPGMAGGPGYTFSRALVEEILDSGIGNQNVLWNEDRAAGVWVDKLVKQGKHINFVDVPGIDGWWKWDWQHPMKNWATWADYPHMVHHGLHGESVACLALADKAADPWRPISRCFAVEVGEQHEAFACARQTEVKLSQAL